MISKALVFEAIIEGFFETEQTWSYTDAIASAVLFGGIGGKTGTGTLTIVPMENCYGDYSKRWVKELWQSQIIQQRE